jgi:hypothetical protein
MQFFGRKTPLCEWYASIHNIKSMPSSSAQLISRLLRYLIAGNQGS